MKIRITSLDVQFKKSSETLRFVDFTYFYGKMGAGKSSIARLIDYCFGGDLDLSPALQSEFVSAKLNLLVEDVPLSIERVRDSNQIIASWTKRDETFDVVIPARTANGEVITGSGVENLSDLLFHLSGIHPPKVRRSKQRDDSDLERLSIRNLLWFCYLDQDSMDSSFFNLETDAAYYKRNKSKDVLRYIVGFHQEQVAELETELQETREKRIGLQSGAESLRKALESGGIASTSELRNRLIELEQELVEINLNIISSRENLRRNIPHQVDILRQRARLLLSELISIEEAVASVGSAIDGDRRHLNELRTLKVKFKRASSAKSILAGVDFLTCPRCSQSLPSKDQGLCQVCGQVEAEQSDDSLTLQVIDNDATSRIQELTEVIDRRSKQLANLKRRQQELVEEKRQTEQGINDATREYDSAYLSTTLGNERRKAEIEQTISKLKEYLRLSSKVEETVDEATNLEAHELELRRKLREARSAAEQDTKNLKVLEQLFLDCLLRARLPGISISDTVSIKAPHFLPEVISPELGDLAVTSFSNISSGGKKSLFKCCFAIALHRLAVKSKAMLPSFLIIDSPMKNISERENREQFEGFHKMLYELAGAELTGVQFILIDKEYFAPLDPVGFEMSIRHMTPDESENPPLIRYHRGH